MNKFFTRANFTAGLSEAKQFNRIQQDAEHAEEENLETKNYVFIAYTLILVIKALRSLQCRFAPPCASAVNGCYLIAIASISTSAALGRAFTSTVALAGGFAVKNRA